MKQCFYIITLSLIVILTSCKREHKPDNLLDTATMTAIMSEYYIIEGYDYMVASRYQDSIGFQSRAAKDSLLKRFNISQADFDSSLAYYIRHQRVFEPMMERVIKNLDDSIRQNQPNNDTAF